MRRNSTKLIALALSVLLALAPGCGTLFGYGFNTTMRVNSEAGAEVLVNGNLRGTAPCELEMDDEESSYRITVRKEGFQDGAVTVSRKVSMLVIVLDIGLSVFTFAIPLMVDAIFGNMYYYPVKDFNIPLKRLQAEPVAPVPSAPTSPPAEPNNPEANSSEPAPAVSFKFCAECGSKLGSTAAFCESCGAKQ